MAKVKSALRAVAKSPAVRREFVVLVRLAAGVLAARYGLNVKF